MNEVILISGAVEYQINLDPTVWIFDERKISLSEHFPGIEDWGMYLAPFLEHAKPKKEATHVIVFQASGQQTTLTLEQAKQAILRFTREGKPIRPDGPALLYLGDGSNAQSPLGSLTQFKVI